MTNDEKSLALTLLQDAIDNTDHPATAVSVLMSAAASILERHFGAAQSVDLMTQALDEAGARLRQGQLN